MFIFNTHDRITFYKQYTDIFPGNKVLADS